MLRFLFGGLATVAGLVLLFVASFGDPGLVLRQLDAAFSTIAPSHAPAVTADNAPVAGGNAPAAGGNAPTAGGNAPAAGSTQAGNPPAEHAMAVVPPSPPQSSPPPQPQASQGPSPAQSSPPSADQAAAMNAQREALRQQLQHLQEQMAQASQNVTSLHSEADAERHDLDALRQQQRAAEQQRAAQEAQAGQRDADREHAAAEAAQPPQPSAPDTQPGPEQAGPAAAPAPIAQAAEQSESLPLPPPPPPNPPQPAPSAAAPTVPPPQVAARTDTMNANRFAAATSPAAIPQRERSQRTGQTDPEATEAVLDRLRHAPPDMAPQAPSPEPDLGAAPGPDSSATRSVDAAAYGQPQQVGPRARLGMARAALQAGRVQEAQQYLEEAQLQLVFRPVTPAGDDDAAPGTSRLAGDVAAALSMLGAGNINGALQYVDRAMQQARSGGGYPPRGYGYGGPYGDGGAPVAEAGH